MTDRQYRFKGQKAKSVLIRFPEETYETLRAAASAKGVSLNSLVNNAVDIFQAETDAGRDIALTGNSLRSFSTGHYAAGSTTVSSAIADSAMTTSTVEMTADDPYFAAVQRLSGEDEDGNE